MRNTTSHIHIAYIASHRISTFAYHTCITNIHNCCTVTYYTCISTLADKKGDKPDKVFLTDLSAEVDPQNSGIHSEMEKLHDLLMEGALEEFQPGFEPISGIFTPKVSGIRCTTMGR